MQFVRSAPWRGGTVAQRSDLLGREAELARLAAVLEAARAGGSAALVVRGDAGVGKTQLLERVAAEAAAAGMTVLQAGGVEREQDLPFGALSELCRPVVDRLDDLAARHRDPLAGALALAAPTPGDRFTTGVALLGLLSALARERPLLCVVDDIQWVDAASADALTFVAGRIEGEGIVLLFGHRAGEESAVDVTRLEELSVAPLPPSLAMRLVRELAPTAAADVAERVVAGTAGNPLAITELVAGLDDDELDGISPLPDPMPVGPSLEQVFLRRLQRLGDHERRALLVAAASAAGSLHTVLAALRAADLDPAALEPAEREGMVAVGHGRVVFSHPLLRAAVYHAAPPPDRRWAHALLASVLDPVADLDRRAWHLARCTVEPDAAVAAEITAAGRQALARRAWSAAASALEDAARLSPSDGARASALVEASEAALRAGLVERARALAENAIPLAADGATRAAAVHARAAAQLAGGSASGVSAVLVATADEVEDEDPERAARMLTDAAALYVEGGRGEAGVEAARRAVDLAEPMGGVVLETASMVLGAALALAGDTVTAKLYLRALEPLLSHPELPLASQRALNTAALVLIWIEDYDAARRVLDQLAEAGRSRGMPGVLPAALITSAILEFGVGEWDKAVAAASEAAELAEQTGQLDVWTRAMTHVALIEGCRGDEAACRQRVAQITAAASEDRNRFRRETLRGALAELALALDDPHDAIEQLEPLRSMARSGNPAPTLWEGALLEAYAGAGRLEDAAALLGEFEARLESGRNRRGRSMAARTRGLLASEDGFDAEFAVALQLVEQPAIPFPMGRVQMLWGRRLREAGRLAEAHHRLRAALALFERVGATTWARRARADLDAIGGDAAEPASAGAAGAVAAVAAEPPALSVQDRTILDAADRGESAEAIAARLFLSPSTVERRLSSARTRARSAPPSPLSPSLPSVEVRLLGAFEVVVDGVDCTPPAGVPARAVEVVALRGGQLHAEELVEALWPETDADKGRTRLRNVLGRVRRAAPEVLVRRGSIVSLGDGVSVDVDLFEDEASRALALASADPASAERLGRSALDRYRGDLTPDLLYEPWATAPRERLRQRHVALLDLLAGFAAARGSLGEAAALLERAVEAEPLDEERYVRAASLLAERRPVAARRFVARARAAAAELGVPPSPQLLELEQQLGVD